MMSIEKKCFIHQNELAYRLVVDESVCRNGGEKDVMSVSKFLKIVRRVDLFQENGVLTLQYVGH